MRPRSLLAGLTLLLALGATAHAQERHLRLDGRLGAIRISYEGGRHGHGVRASYHRRERRHDEGRRHRYRSSRGSKVWVPGHDEVVPRRVWEPAHFERVWVEPIYETTRDFWGRRHRVLVRAGHWSEVFVPGRYVVREVRVWRPGAWRVVD